MKEGMGRLVKWALGFGPIVIQRVEWLWTGCDKGEECGF